jgi:hypothetical protein
MKEALRGMKRFVCKNCGTINELSRQAMQRSTDRLEGELPRGFECKLPAAKITSATGQPVHISGSGEHLSHEAYLKKYKIDPENACNCMRGESRSHPSLISSFQEHSVRDRHLQNKRTRDWLDEDYWTD